MPRTRIKICGITRPQDAIAAANAGADAIGMVLHAVNRPRQIGIDAAMEILSVLPPMVGAVGVFLDAPAEFVLDTARRLRLRHIQLHGHETPQYIQNLGDLQVIKAILLDSSLDLWRNAPPQVRAFLLESSAGGTGVETDWQKLATLRDRNETLRSYPLIAAGGLKPENVAQVVSVLRPWAVDVSSGVEESIGIKSPAKIEAFCREVRSIEMANKKSRR